MEAKPALAATGPTSKSPSKVLVTASEKEWDAHFQSLLEFKKKNGHCLVPKVYPENRRLSYWVFRQRSQYTEREKGNPSSLSKEHEKKLKEVGFVFKVKGNKEYLKMLQSKGNERFELTWEKYFIELKEYKQKKGNCLVPKVYPEHPAFQGWVYRLRTLYKKRSRGIATNLSDAQIEKLNSIGFVWDAKNDAEWRKKERKRKSDQGNDIWEECFNDLIAFKEKTGHTSVPKIYMKNQKLSSWVFRMRSNYKKRQNGDIMSMDDDRLKRLNDIDFIWKVRTSKSPSPVKVNAVRQKTPTLSSKKPSKLWQRGKKTTPTFSSSGGEQIADDDNPESILKSCTKDEEKENEDEDTEDEDETEDEEEDEQEGSINDIHMEDVSVRNGGKKSTQHSDPEDLTCAVASAAAKNVSRRRFSLQSTTIRDNRGPKIVTVSSTTVAKILKLVQEPNSYVGDDSISSNHLDEINKMILDELLRPSAFFFMNGCDQELLRVVEASNLSREKNQNKLDYVKNNISQELSEITGFHTTPAPLSIDEIVQKYSANMEASAKAEFVEKRRQSSATRKRLSDRFHNPMSSRASNKRKLDSYFNKKWNRFENGSVAADNGTDVLRRGEIVYLSDMALNDTNKEAMLNFHRCVVMGCREIEKDYFYYNVMFDSDENDSSTTIVEKVHAESLITSKEISQLIDSEAESLNSELMSSSSRHDDDDDDDDRLEKKRLKHAPDIADEKLEKNTQLKTDHIKKESEVNLEAERLRNKVAVDGEKGEKISKQNKDDSKSGHLSSKGCALRHDDSRSELNSPTDAPVVKVVITKRTAVDL